jgi:small GTP-binding protein
MSENEIKLTAFKLVLCGDTSVGKTGICTSFLGLEFNENYLATIITEKWNALITLKNGETMKLIFYDASGTERVDSIILKNRKFVQGVILVFDLTNRQSLINVDGWLKGIKDYNPNIDIILFGNKCDKEENQWQVKREEAQEFAKKRNLEYFETSAKLGKGIKEGFNYISNAIYDRLERKKGIELKNREDDNNSGCPGGKTKKKNTNK